ncbi:hypothetical protein CHS0354_031079 [Potamilus streckersoni]|uniref:Aftiphilin clathrin-binding box domain-containing protein n=1 Tax=Potamilus streckersoni TaxID=2493646 RepID=A0AAE0RZK2_9BIVA|nr:hypothetical protein CHS0354_031079 [Potamilus streckersoni]
MSSFIPMVSSSPPPLDDDGGGPDDDWDNDEFGNFTGADDIASTGSFHGHHKNKLDILNVSSENDKWTEPKSSQIEENSSSDTKDASPKPVDVDFANFSQFAEPENKNFHVGKGISESGIMDGFEDGEDEGGTKYIFISTDVENKFSDLDGQGDITSTNTSSPSDDDDNFVTNKESSRPADGVIILGSMTDSGHGSSDFSPIQQSIKTPEFSTKTVSVDGADIIEDEQTNSIASQDKCEKFLEDISSSEPSVSEGYMSHSNVTPTDEEKNILNSETQCSSDRFSEYFNDDNRHCNPDFPFVRSNESENLEMDSNSITHQDKYQLEHSHNDAFNDDDDDFQDFSVHSVQANFLSEIHSSIGTSDSKLEMKGVNCPASGILVEESDTSECGIGAGHTVKDCDSSECGTGTGHKVEGCVMGEPGTGAEEGELPVVNVHSTCTLGTNRNQDTKHDKKFTSAVGESGNMEIKEKGLYSADANDLDIDNSARNAKSDKDLDISANEFEDFSTFEVGLFYKSKDEASDTSWASFPVQAESFVDEKKGASDEDNDHEVRAMCCSSPEDKYNANPAEQTITESDFGDMDSFSDIQSNVENSEKKVVSEMTDIEKKPQHNIGAEADDEFGDFGDFTSVGTVSDNTEVVEAAMPAKPHEQEKFVEFAAFVSKETQEILNTDNWAAFSSGSSATSVTSTVVDALESSAGSKFGSRSATEQIDDNGDDNENLVAYSRVQPQSPTVVSSSSVNISVTAETNSQTQSKLGRVKQAVVGCFPSGLCLISEDTPQKLDHFVDSSITKSYRPFVWCSIKDMDNTDALLYHWSESTWNRQLFSTLKIDTRNILFGKKKQSYVPLTPLEPTKILTPAVVKSDDIFKPDPNQVITQEIPPAQFDWSSSGLVNPLAGANNNLNLDFLIQDSEAINKSIALESEFLADYQSSIAKPTMQPLENILASVKATSTFKKTNQNEALSKEAQDILQSLPDLTFMKAKVLMFPISNKSCD